MKFEAVRAYLGRKKGATEEYPFDTVTLVFKVAGKLYALLSENEAPPRLTLKCDPPEAEALRAAYPTIRPGRYLHKAHWNTVTLDGTVPDDLLREMLDDSYALVVAGLKKADREALR